MVLQAAALTAVIMGIVWFEAVLLGVAWPNLQYPRERD